MFAMDGVVTATNSSIAIAAAIVVATDPRAVPVLLVPALSVLVLYRAYIAERQRHEQLEFLYEANRALSRSPEVAEAIEGLLAKSLEAFRSEIAEVVLFGADGTPLRTTHGPGDERATMVEASREASHELASLVDRDTPVAALVQPIEHAPLRAHLEQRRIRNAMVAMLPGENRMIGTIMLANRFGIERGYGPEDLRLLEALANNASVALQYDRLEQAVTRLRALQEQLHHQAYHDPLTDLPEPLAVHGSGQGGARERHRRDRRPLHRCRRLQGRQRLAGPHRRRCAARLRRRAAAPLGPAAGRLVARLGGDEFAVMLPALDDAEAQAERVAPDPRRVRPLLSKPARSCFRSPQRRHHRQRPSADADELIRDADLAMYRRSPRARAA